MSRSETEIPMALAIESSVLSLGVGCDTLVPISEAQFNAILQKVGHRHHPIYSLDKNVRAVLKGKPVSWFNRTKHL